MKSLLVDALRKAQDEPADNPTGKPSEAADGESAKESPREIDDACLLEPGASDSRRGNDEACFFESTAAHLSRSTDDLSLFETQAVVIEQGVVAQNDDLIDEDNVADALSDQSGSQMDLQNQARTPDVPDYSTDEHAELQVAQSVAGRVAGATPVVCVIALLSAATARFLVDSHFAGSINDNMVEVSASERPAVDEVESGGDESDLAIEKIDLFNRRETAAVVDQELPARPVTVQVARHIQEPEALQNDEFEIDSSSANTGMPNDLAFALVTAGYQSYRADDYATAEEKFTDALRIEPNHRDALAGRAAVYQKTERINLALLEYEKLLSADPGNTLATSALLALRSTTMDGGGASEIKYLIQRFPDAHHLHYALGLLFVGEKRWADARHAFRLAYDLAPGIADYSYNLAVSMERLGESGSARHYYKIAVSAADEKSNFDIAAVKSHLTVMKDGTGESS